MNHKTWAQYLLEVWAHNNAVGVRMAPFCWRRWYLLCQLFDLKYTRLTSELILVQLCGCKHIHRFCFPQKRIQNENEQDKLLGAFNIIIALMINCESVDCSTERENGVKQWRTGSKTKRESGIAGFGCHCCSMLIVPLTEQFYYSCSL